MQFPIITGEGTPGSSSGSLTPVSQSQTIASALAALSSAPPPIHPSVAVTHTLSDKRNPAPCFLYLYPNENDIYEKLMRPLCSQGNMSCSFLQEMQVKEKKLPKNQPYFSFYTVADRVELDLVQSLSKDLWASTEENCVWIILTNPRHFTRNMILPRIYIPLSGFGGQTNQFLVWEYRHDWELKYTQQIDSERALINPEQCLKELSDVMKHWRAPALPLPTPPGAPVNPPQTLAVASTPLSTTEKIKDAGKFYSHFNFSCGVREKLLFLDGGIQEDLKKEGLTFAINQYTPEIFMAHPVFRIGLLDQQQPADLIRLTEDNTLLWRGTGGNCISILLVDAEHYATYLKDFPFKDIVNSGFNGQTQKYLVWAFRKDPKDNKYHLLIPQLYARELREISTEWPLLSKTKE